MMVQKIIKHGNSLAVVIPVEATHAMGIKKGDLVVLVFPSENHIMLDFIATKEYPQKALEIYKEQHRTIKHDRA